jgi:hypothetical protein
LSIRKLPTFQSPAPAFVSYERTFNKGGSRLMELLESIPPDRTEEEYRELQERAAAENEAAIEANLKAYNERRQAQGEPPIDRQGNPILTALISADDPQK